MAANIGPNPNLRTRHTPSRPHGNIQSDWRHKKKTLAIHQGWLIATDAQQEHILELLWSSMQGYYLPGISPLPSYRPVNNSLMAGPLPLPLVVPEGQVINAVVAHVMGGAQANPAAASANPAPLPAPLPPPLQHPAFAGPAPFPVHNNHGFGPAFVLPAGTLLPAPMSYTQLQQSLSLQQWLAIIQFTGNQL